MKRTMAEQMKFSTSARDLAAYWSLYEPTSPVQSGLSLHRIAYNFCQTLLDQPTDTFAIILALGQQVAQVNPNDVIVNSLYFHKLNAFDFNVSLEAIKQALKQTLRNNPNQPEKQKKTFLLKWFSIEKSMCVNHLFLSTMLAVIYYEYAAHFTKHNVCYLPVTDYELQMI